MSRTVRAPRARSDVVQRASIACASECPTSPSPRQAAISPRSHARRHCRDELARNHLTVSLTVFPGQDV